MANECGNVREEMKQECLGNCGLKIMSRKEFYEQVLKEVTEVQQELWTASTEESVNEALNKLEKLMGDLIHSSQAADIKAYISNISETIKSVKLHDSTRAIIADMIQMLNNRVKEIIEEEKKKENSGKLRNLFLELAEHAEQIAEIIDINKIFG